MSYARFGAGGSDVYVFLSTRGLECCGCILQDREMVEDETAPGGWYLRPVGEIVESSFSTTQGMLDHLQHHRDAEHIVRDDTLACLEHDRAENDRWIANPGDR